MGQILHTNARTREAIGREFHNSEESIAKAAAKFNVNPKTIIKWTKREDPKDLSVGPKIKSTVCFSFNFINIYTLSQLNLL